MERPERNLFTDISVWMGMKIVVLTRLKSRGAQCCYQRVQNSKVSI